MSSRDDSLNDEVDDLVLEHGVGMVVCDEEGYVVALRITFVTIRSRSRGREQRSRIESAQYAPSQVFSAAR